MIRTRPALDAMPEYVPGRSAESVAAKYAIGDVIKLASNEAPFPPLPSALAAIADAASGVNRYPDDAAAALREQLAAEYGVAPEQVLLGNGSVELCRMALAATCDPGDEVIFGQPSFEAYPILAMQVGATMVQVPLADHRYDLDAMADAVTDRTRLVFVCNPNNPTGTTVDRDAVDALPRPGAERSARRVRRGLPRVRHRPPTFPTGSTPRRPRERVRAAHLLEGVRARRAARRLRHRGRERDRRAAQGARAVRGERARAGRRVGVARRARTRCANGSTSVIAERARVFDGITDIGLPVVESDANFLWLRCPSTRAVLGEYSERAGVVLRPFPGVGVRVTIGTAAENDRSG